MKISVMLLLLSISLAERILLLSPIGSRSHLIFYMGIVERLAKRGHQITVLSGHKPLKKTKNIEDVQINDAEIVSHIVSNAFEDSNSAMRKVIQRSPEVCSDILAQNIVQDLKKEKFDLIIISMFMSDCFLSLAPHFKVPLVYILPVGIYCPFCVLVNNIDFPSLSGSKLLSNHFPLSFTERLYTIYYNGLISLFYHYHATYRMEIVCRERGLCAEDMLTLREIRNNVSLVVINKVRTMEWPPRPMMPNIIYAGGAYTKPTGNLSQDLEEWIAGAGEEGFIFFSLGSALKSLHLPEKYRQILVKVFGSLKQRVLWKWDETTMPGLPKNAILKKWLPQQDILAHPKLKLFITHGGLLSTTEAMHSGIVVLGMPVFADQFSNLKEAEIEGWCRVVHWRDLEEDTFRNAIISTINNESMKEISRERSILLKDVPIHPGDEAAFWIEYVMRHGGAPHIMSPIGTMPWYELYNMDVYAVMVVATVCLSLFTWYLFRTFLRVLCAIFKTL